MSAARTPPRFLTLALVTGTSLLTLGMIVPSLGHMAQDLNVDYGVISLALGGYLAATALVQLGAGPLADRIGRRPVVLAALAIFTLASLGCALAPDAMTFLVFRMVQAVVVATQVVAQAIIRDTTEGSQTSRQLAFIAMAMALAPLLGPMAGSLLDAAFGWRAGFAAYTLAGAVLLALCWFDLGETRPAANPADPAGSEPLGNLLRVPLFWAYALCTTFSAGGFFVFLAGAPLVATLVFGVPVTVLGAVIGSISLGFMLGSFVSSRASGRQHPTTMIIAGRLVVALGMLAGLAIEALGLTTALLFFCCTIFVGLGNGLSTPNSNAGALSVNRRLAGSAAGINGALNVATGAVLTTATGWVLSRWPASATLLWMLLTVAVAGLIAALAARRLDRPRRGL